MILSTLPPARRSDSFADCRSENLQPLLHVTSYPRSPPRNTCADTPAARTPLLHVEGMRGQPPLGVYPPASPRGGVLTSSAPSFAARKSPYMAAAAATVPDFPSPLSPSLIDPRAAHAKAALSRAVDWPPMRIDLHAQKLCSSATIWGVKKKQALERPGEPDRQNTVFIVFGDRLGRSGETRHALGSTRSWRIVSCVFRRGDDCFAGMDGSHFTHLASDEAKLSPDIPRGLLSPTSSATGIINPARDLHS